MMTYGHSFVNTADSSFMIITIMTLGYSFITIKIITLNVGFIIKLNGIRL